MKKEEIIKEFMDRAEKLNSWGADYGCRNEAFTFTSMLQEKGIEFEHDEDFWSYFEDGCDYSDLREMLKAYGLKKSGFTEIPTNYELRYNVEHGKTFGYEEKLLSEYDWDNCEEGFIEELYEKLGCKTIVRKGIKEEERYYDDGLWRSADGKYERTNVLKTIVPEQVWTFLDFEMEIDWDDDELYEEALRFEMESIYDEGGWMDSRRGYIYISEDIPENFYEALDLFPGKRLSDFEELWEDGCLWYIVKTHEAGLEFKSVPDELEFYEKSIEYGFDFTSFALKSAARNGGKFDPDYFEYYKVWSYNSEEIA